MADAATRGLGVVDASLIVVGSIVGAGIFFVSPSVARHVASPAAFLAVWLVGGGVALAGALSNGELGGMFPRSGGEYVYLREAYGPPLGFLSGWTSFLIVFPGSIATLAYGLGMTVAPVLGFGASAVAMKTVGVVAIVALTGVNAFGLRPGKWTQNVLSVTKLLAFAGLLGMGLLVRHGTRSGLVPFFAPGDRAPDMAIALVSVFFAYSGWNAATYVAGEMRDPRRSLGRALALGTALCIALYLAVNAAYLRALPIAALRDATDPARATAMTLLGGAAAAVLSPLVAVCALSSMQASVLVGPRIYYAMAVDGLFFAPFGRLHRTTGVPLLALLMQGAISLVLLVTGSFDQVLKFTTFAMVAFATLTVGAVLVLRFRRPHEPRAFPVPGYPWVPVAFIAVNAFVLWSVLTAGVREALYGLGIVATGLPAYAAFRARSRPQEIAR